MKSTPRDEQLSEESQLNLTGKLLLTSLGSWLVGKPVNTKIRGSKDEIEAIANALLASRKFQDELRHPGASVQSVVDKLHVKQMTAIEFERVFGIPWPL
jgi:hypothetical protein